MTSAVLKLPSSPPVERQALPSDASLDMLRRIAAQSRLKPRVDLDVTCRLLRAEPGQAAEAYALAFLRTVAAAMDRPLRFHRPGAVEQTFDEAWVSRLLRCLREGDLDSALFCIGSRIPRNRRATVRFLAGALAERLDILSLEPF